MAVHVTSLRSALLLLVGLFEMRLQYTLDLALHTYMHRCLFLASQLSTTRAFASSINVFASFSRIALYDSLHSTTTPAQQTS
jgi:hypothetical protein